jgi:hypothetical protein
MERAMDIDFSPTEIEYNPHDTELSSEEFVVLFATHWTDPIDKDLVGEALSQTINITARHGGLLVACARVLTDGYLFSVITELIVHRDYKRLVPATKLFQLAERAAPTSICFGAQNSENALRELGWSDGPITFYKRKPLRTKPRCETDG